MDLTTNKLYLQIKGRSCFEKKEEEGTTSCKKKNYCC